jgi:hypothetical protein
LAEPVQFLFRAAHDDFHGAVGEIRRPPGDSERQRFLPGGSAKEHSLNAARHDAATRHHVGDDNQDPDM